MRRYSLVDKFLCNIDYFCKKQTILPHSNRPYPAQNIQETNLNPFETKSIISMMKINHCGEVCAQKLYESQARFARNKNLRKNLQESAIEEQDHLNWCKMRLKELGAKPSYLNNFFAIGSYAIGSIFAIAGDKWSLGFLAETEQQVTKHLEQHLTKIPLKDQKTISILNQMRTDEMEHATKAIEQGASELPQIIKTLMTYSSKVMTTVVG